MYYNESQTQRNASAAAVEEYQFRLRNNLSIDPELEERALATLAQWEADERATEAAR